MAITRQKGQEEVAAERAIKALTLRQGGLSFREIGRMLRVSHECARQDVLGALTALTAQAIQCADQLRELELARLDLATYAIFEQVKLGDSKAVNCWIRLSESRRKLLGLDAPTRIVDETGKMTDAELIQRIMAKAQVARPPDKDEQKDGR